ncbi:class I SAM-dependent methyltransferase [Marinicella meishanensis]|uniref:class I SAM-dependent methyltransferase n=1 Tax=Marinicella meishanensis TaxID=2873263 RepID=UPI001CC0BCBC|nr:class I SAM-dependent methyltransferase [Marinicella sp. NBU2979]
MSSLSQKIKLIEDRGVFLGGPKDLFELAGRKMLMLLLSEGLEPESKVLDLGCGCLRGGYWFIHFLQSGGYHGIEPNRAMLQAGLEALFSADMLAQKQPRFVHNTAFDPSEFEQQFDYFLARSIWTHAAKKQITMMLDAFAKWTHDDAAFFTSYLEATNESEEYWGNDWVGKSHESDTAGVVKHSMHWIEAACQDRGLKVTSMDQALFDLDNAQRWLKITHQA